MANNEDVNQANQGAPAADIPDLKKKEKERKKAGAAWSGAKPGGGSFSGASGGSVARAAASAASASGGVAGGMAGAGAGAAGGFASFFSSIFAGLSGFLAQMTATVLGKMMLAAGVAAFLMGAGLLGYAMLKGEGNGGVGGVDLGALSSSMRIRGDGGDRTGYVASNGEIMFDPLKAAEAKKAEEKAPEDKAAGDAVPADPMAEMGAGAGGGGGAGWNRPGLEHNLSGSKLSSSLGGGFGGKNIFAGNSSAPKLNTEIGKVKIQGGQKGRLSASRNARTGRAVAGKSAQKLKANKAFGQLKVAKGLSTQGAGGTVAEGARSTAGSAFDGPTRGAGNIEGGPTGNGLGTGPTGTVATPSTPGGAPDVTTVPNVDVPTGVALDPNSAAMIAGIASLAKKAGEMKKKAAQLMIAGIALIAVGVALLFWPMTAIGVMLIAIGSMLVGMSIMMSQMAAMMKGMADSMSEGLAARTTDTRQDEINKYCIDKAYNEGRDPKNCNPPPVEPITEANNSSEDGNESSVDKEHSDMVTETGRVEGGNGRPTEVR